MEYLLDSWSMIVILLAAFVIGWAAETAQTFIPKALALSILAWLQTLPEFAVEAAIAWQQNRELMIANLTGSLRLLVGLGWPMIFFVHFFFQGVAKGKYIKEIKLGNEDAHSVLFLFLSVTYFIYVLVKGTLTCWDSVWLTVIYIVYLVVIARQPAGEMEEVDDLPWIGKKIVRLQPVPKVMSVVFLFVAGGIALYVSVHPFIDTLQKWAVGFGISTFVFIQWVAPFLSEFPEKVSAFNWARQANKAPMGIMNMVASNINQWTMLAAMIPIVFNISLGYFEPVVFDHVHWVELALTIAQSFLAGMLILDLKFSIVDAALLFALWITQFFVAHLREEIAILYLVWIGWELGKAIYIYSSTGRLPRAVEALRPHRA
jgi:cation:H+ antiporter